MSVIEKTLSDLTEVNKGLNLTNELQTLIHPEVFFRRNSVNLLIGKKGSGKTYNVFRELIKLRHVPDHRYTKLIYVTDKAYDPTYDRLKHLIPLTVERVHYVDAAQKIREVSEAKVAMHDIVSNKIDLNDLTDDSKQTIADTLGGEINNTEEIFHTAVLLDDCQNIFDRKTKANAELFKMLFENRQPKITYFLTMQDPKHLDSSLKQNLDACWFFGGFTEHKFKYLMSDIPHEGELIDLWVSYRQLTKHQAIILFITEAGTEACILNA